jgi:hypothetical protein
MILISRRSTWYFFYYMKLLIKKRSDRFKFVKSDQNHLRKFPKIPDLTKFFDGQIVDGGNGQNGLLPLAFRVLLLGASGGSRIVFRT